MSSIVRKSSKAAVVSDFRRAQILAAARQSFSRRGVTDTTMEAVAKAAGVAKGTVYLYYRSKDEMLHQILTEDLTELNDDGLLCAGGPGTLEERLRRFLHAVISFFERRRDFIEHCQFEMGSDVRKKAKQKFGLVFAAQIGAWRTVLADESRQGTAHVADPEGTARAIVSLAHGMAIHRLKGWHTDPIDAAVRAASDLVLQGVRAR